MKVSLVGECLLTRIAFHNTACQRKKFPREHPDRIYRYNLDDGGLIETLSKEESLTMSEFEAEVKKAERELEQGLVPVEGDQFTGKGTDEFLGDFKMQAEEYGQKIQDAAGKAYDFASDKFTQAGDKFRDLSNKDPRELVEDAKEFARQKPGQTILISAAVGLVLGLILRGRK
jgi:ElaB/YqjD/DUF883 family membrane-anchored ribosome-binding protein